jgi:ferric-dicitrate binding protein FerR (iron transport regulator)
MDWREYYKSTTGQVRNLTMASSSSVSLAAESNSKFSMLSKIE